MEENLENIVIKAQEGDEEAEIYLINWSMRYVNKLVKHFCSNNINLCKDDLTQDGLVGIIKAINTYNPKKNVKFSTHVYNSIVYNLIYQVKNKYSMIRVPDHIVSAVSSFNKQRKEIQNCHMTEENLCKALKMSYSEYRNMLRINNLNNTLSLNSTISQGDEKEEFLNNLLYDDVNYKKVEDRLYLSSIAKNINCKLTDLEKYIISKTIVFNKPIKDIAFETKIPQKKLSQLKYMALKKIRNTCN